MTTLPLTDSGESVDDVDAGLWVWRPETQLRLSIVAGVLLALAMVARWSGVGVMHEVSSWSSLLIGLVYGVRAALGALAERRVDIDVLMVVAALAAAAVGHAEEGALLLVLFTFAGALEQLAMERTKREIHALHAVMPDRAITLRGGEWVGVEPGEVRVGEEIRVRPGDRVPVDAEVVDGASSLDESTLTGESVPRQVSEGDGIYAGTINGEGVLRARVTRLASESSVQRVLALVTEAREQREPLQRLIDRLGQPYTVTVLVASTVVFFVWWLFLPGELGGRRTAWEAGYTAITFLIVASPCALIIATPTATLAAIARGARAGVLFKGGESIDRLSRTGAVCFDKTGTLTVGRPVYQRLIRRENGSGPDLLAVAAGLERDSTHPTARAIFEAAPEPASLERVRSAAGRGMVGVWHGVEARAGNLAFVREVVDESAGLWLEARLASVRSEGCLGVAVAAGASVGVIVLRDELRRGARDLVETLHGLGIRPVRMLTGDDEIVAQRIASEVGVDEYRAQLLPEQKVAEVDALRAECGVAVAMVGDGVNDAPVLAAADVSLAVGSIGSDAALESADIVLLSEDLSRVPWAIGLARATRRTVAANLAFAGSVIVVMAGVVVLGSLFGLRVPMAAGVVAHEGGTVVVVLNSLRLLWFGRRNALADG